MVWVDPGVARPIVCGHRGAPAIAPENTLAGFRVAADRGATWIEFDVRPTSDGVLAIHHDPQTSRGIRLASTPFAELDPMIPSFDQMAAAVPQLGFDIEMKTDEIDMSLDAFAELVIASIDQSCDGVDGLIVTSFDARALACVRNRREDIATGLLFWEGELDDVLATAVDAGHVAIAPWIRLLDAAMVERARNHALDVLTWTVNEPDDVRTASQLGVDMIIGDDPATICDNLARSEESGPA